MSYPAQMASMDAHIDERIVMKKLKEYFVERLKLLYSVVLSIFLTREDLVWQQLSSQILQ